MGELTDSGAVDGVRDLRRYKDVAAAGVEPMRHFIGLGWR
jgi:hypothetical protein